MGCEMRILGRILRTDLLRNAALERLPHSQLFSEGVCTKLDAVSSLRAEI